MNDDQLKAFSRTFRDLAATLNRAASDIDGAGTDGLEAAHDLLGEVQNSLALLDRRMAPSNV